MRATFRAFFSDRRFAQIGLASICALLLALSTHWGIGVASDSTEYLGLRAPDPGLAPLYRWIMHAAGALDWNVVATARVYHIVLYAGTAVLIWRFVTAATGSAASAWGAALLVVFTSQALDLYSMALSDPTFVFLMVLGFVLLWRWTVERSEAYFFAAAGIAALAALARFPGVALAGAGAIIVLAADGALPLRRIARAMTFGAIGLAPILTWMLAVKLESGTFAGRSLAIRSVDPEVFRNGGLEAARFLLPAQVPARLRVAALLGGLAVLVAATVYYYRIASTARPAGAKPEPRHALLPAILIAFLGFYLAIVAVSVLIEPSLPIQERYLYPAYVCAVLLGSVTTAAWNTTRLRRAAIATAVVGLIALDSLRTAAAVYGGYTDGRGFTSLGWRRSETVAFVRKLPHSAAVYSNNYFALLYLAGRPTRQVPAKIIRRLGQPDPGYNAAVRSMRHALSATGGVVVYFDRQRDAAGELLTLRELERRMPLVLAARFDDGAAYAIASARVSQQDGEPFDEQPSSSLRR